LVIITLKISLINHLYIKMTPSELLTYLLQQAEDIGLKEGRLAENAGLTPQGLSKAKSRGDLRVSSLEALGRQVGIELVWRPVQQNGETAAKVRSGTLFQLGHKSQGKD
jgi:hypothetical protein